MPKVKSDSMELFDFLRNSRPHREIYLGRDGAWRVTHRGGKWSNEAVQYLVERKLISPVYSSQPRGSFHVGPTVDTEATLAARKNGAPKGTIIYVPNSAPKPQERA